MLASGSQEREPRICHHRCQDFSTRQSCSSSLLGGNLLNTSSPTSVPMGRAWSKCGIQKGSSLSTETFGAEIRRSARCGFCHPGSSQGSTHRAVSRPCALRCVARRALLFEADNNRRLVDSDLLRRFSGAAISCLPAVPLARFHLRESSTRKCSTS